MKSTKVIAYQQTNGLVALVHPSDYTDLTLQEIAEKDVPKGCDYIILDSADLPTRLYRDKWRLCKESNHVVVDFDESSI